MILLAPDNGERKSERERNQAVNKEGLYSFRSPQLHFTNALLN